MNRINTHEAKTRFCRNGKAVAELRPRGRSVGDRLRTIPELKPKFSSKYDPMAPLDEDEWLEDLR